MQPALGSPATGVIVTGDASGLGRANAEALAAVGRPVSIWDLDAEAASAVAKDLASSTAVTAEGLAVPALDLYALIGGVERARKQLPSVGAFTARCWERSPRANGPWCSVMA